jgi:hypothetical protein
VAAPLVMRAASDTRELLGGASLGTILCCGRPPRRLLRNCGRGVERAMFGPGANWPCLVQALTGHVWVQALTGHMWVQVLTGHVWSKR